MDARAASMGASGTGMGLGRNRGCFSGGSGMALFGQEASHCEYSAHESPTGGNTRSREVHSPNYGNVRRRRNEAPPAQSVAKTSAVLRQSERAFACAGRKIPSRWLPQFDVLRRAELWRRYGHDSRSVAVGRHAQASVRLHSDQWFGDGGCNRRARRDRSRDSL